MEGGSIIDDPLRFALDKFMLRYFDGGRVTIDELARELPKNEMIPLYSHLDVQPIVKLLMDEVEQLRNELKLRSSGGIDEAKNEVALVEYGHDAVVDHVFIGSSSCPPMCSMCGKNFSKHARVPKNMVVSMSKDRR